MKPWLVFLMIAASSVGGCASKDSAIEGSLTDWNNAPVSGVTVTALPDKPLKGYERSETVTKSDGTFRLTGLFPASAYSIMPASDRWKCDGAAAVHVESAPKGKTLLLPSPLMITRAYSRDGGNLIIDLATGATRIAVSTAGDIRDAKTNLEWRVIPRQLTYPQAMQLLDRFNADDGGWRLPTVAELEALYIPELGENVRDPAFNAPYPFVWTAHQGGNMALIFSLRVAYTPQSSIWDENGMFAVREMRDVMTAQDTNVDIGAWERVSMVVIGPGPQGFSGDDLDMLQGRVNRANLTGESSLGGFLGKGVWIVCASEKKADWLRSLSGLTTITIDAEFDGLRVRNWRPFPLRGAFLELRVKGRPVAETVRILDALLKAAGATVWNVIVGDEPGDSICLISDTALDPGVVAQKFGKQVEIRRSETWSTRSAR